MAWKFSFRTDCIPSRDPNVWSSELQVFFFWELHLKAVQFKTTKMTEGCFYPPIFSVHSVLQFYTRSSLSYATLLSKAIDRVSETCRTPLAWLVVPLKRCSGEHSNSLGMHVNVPGGTTWIALKASRISTTWDILLIDDILQFCTSASRLLQYFLCAEKIHAIIMRFHIRLTQFYK